VLEAMKMEHRIVAPIDGVVVRVSVEQGQMVDGGQVLVELEDAAAEEEGS
jgi:biotin carboxyl carrier protein